MMLNNELNLIQNLAIREWTKKTLENAPEYFWKAQASSTGKYHPACTIKEGGLITHVKRAVYIVDRLSTGWGLNEIQRDIVISATILHDIAKVGNPTVAKTTYDDYLNHPLNAEKYFAKVEKETNVVNVINQCIKNHMGLWTPDSIKKAIEDYSLLELIVYTADYLATTKDLVTPRDNE